MFHRSNTETPLRTPTDADVDYLKWLRRKGYGYEDIEVKCRSVGIAMTRADARRFVIGPRRTTALGGQSEGRFAAR